MYSFYNTRQLTPLYIVYFFKYKHFNLLILLSFIFMIFVTLVK